MCITSKTNTQSNTQSWTKSLIVIRQTELTNACVNNVYWLTCVKIKVVISAAWLFIYMISRVVLSVPVSEVYHSVFSCVGVTFSMYYDILFNTSPLGFASGKITIIIQKIFFPPIHLSIDGKIETKDRSRIKSERSIYSVWGIVLNISSIRFYILISTLRYLKDMRVVKHRFVLF